MVERKATVGGLTFEIERHFDQRDGDWRTVKVSVGDRGQAVLQQRDWDELKVFVDEELERP